MVKRWSLLGVLGLLLCLASGCPEPGEDDPGDGDESGETDGSGETDEPDPGGDGDDPVGDGDGDPGDGDPGDGDPGDGDPGDVIDHTNRCWDETWNGDELPALIFDNTIGRNDDFIGSCGIGAAPDYQLGFVAPWTGSFTFDTSGSSFDTVVYLNDGECGTPELACNDDFINLESRVTIDLKAGEIVTVTVDGAGPFEEGPLKLLITEASPPVCESEMIVPNLPQQIIGDTTGGPSELASGCGGSGAPEQVYRFTAPGPGSYRFDTAGSDFDTTLYLLDDCADAPLTCNDDADFELQSALEVELDGGQEVLVVVDGHEPEDFGSFVLNVDKL